MCTKTGMGDYCSVCGEAKETDGDGNIPRHVRDTRDGLDECPGTGRPPIRGEGAVFRALNMRGPGPDLEIRMAFGG